MTLKKKIAIGMALTVLPLFLSYTYAARLSGVWQVVGRMYGGAAAIGMGEMTERERRAYDFEIFSRTYEFRRNGTGTFSSVDRESYEFSWRRERIPLSEGRWSGLIFALSANRGRLIIDSIYGTEIFEYRVDIGLFGRNAGYGPVLELSQDERGYILERPETGYHQLASLEGRWVANGFSYRVREGTEVTINERSMEFHPDGRGRFLGRGGEADELFAWAVVRGYPMAGGRFRGELSITSEDSGESELFEFHIRSELREGHRIPMMELFEENERAIIIRMFFRTELNEF